MVPRAVAFTIVWPEGVIFGSIMTYHVQFLLLVRQPLFDRAALPLTQTSWVLPPLSVGKMTLRLYSALNYSHGLSKGPSFGTGRDTAKAQELETWLSRVVAGYGVLPMDAAAFREWARHKHGKSDTLIEDAMIAARARVHRLTVATRNVRDFREFYVELFDPFDHE